MDFKEIAQHHNLDWELAVEPMCLTDQTPTQYQALVRQDNRDVFGCVKKYTPFQNIDLLRLAYGISERTDLPVRKAISIDGGRKIMVQLECEPIENIGPNKDTIEQYVTILNAHDGKGALRWGISQETLSCKNQWHKIGKSFSRVPHSRYMMEYMDNYIDDLQQMKSLQQHTAEILRRASKIPCNQNHIDDFVYALTGCDEDSHGRTRRLDRDLRAAIDHEQAYKGKNLWSLFEGLTYYTSHTQNCKDHELSKVAGHFSKKDTQGYNTMLQMVERYA